MMTPVQLRDRTEFLAAVAASGLLPPSHLARATAALPGDKATASDAAQFLIATGFLTRFQADRLLAGRTEGFILDPYVIQEQIGRGPIGRVYRAIHRTMNRVVAIKLLSPDVTRTATARQAFQREVRAAARLNHPHIVTAYDANEIGERSYLVMEFVDGPTVDILVQDRGPLPVAEACELVRQVAVGLSHAHELGMPHGDIKPANLLVTRASKTLPGCVVKIADFGIARLAPVRQTGVSDQTPAPGRLTGTPDYLAPEQANTPQTADHRADLYSLGCVFYYLLTGRPPFPGGTPDSKMRRHQLEVPIPVERLRPEIPLTVAQIVHRLLAKDPNNRLQTAAELAACLEVLAAGEVAVDDGAAVSFELPPVQAGSYSFTSGYLTGCGPVRRDVAAAPAPPPPAAYRTADPSPWANLAHVMPANDNAEPEPCGLGESVTGLVLPPLRSQSPAGVSPITSVVLCGSVVVLCMVALGYFLRLMAK